MGNKELTIELTWWNDVYGRTFHDFIVRPTDDEKLWTSEKEAREAAEKIAAILEKEGYKIKKVHF